MAGTMQFDLVSPERRLARTQVAAVQIPAAEGDMTAMPGHAPVITTLRPGILRAEAGGAAQAYAVIGGFAEITAGAVSVLAERAVPLAEATPEMLEALLAEARARLAAGPADRVAAEKYLADLEALRAAIAA
jgi:F-type H+-transporting ATPase subunit epsilon